MKQLEPVIDNASSGQVLKTEMVEGTCNKEVYKRGEYRIVLFQDAKGVSGSVTPAANAIDPAVMSACLAKTELVIDKIKYPIGKSIFDSYRTQFPNIWSDFDIGATKWLSCKDTNARAYYDSIPVLLHELTHDLREDPCLFTAQGKVCFDLSPNLPLRSVAALKSFPSKDENTVQGLSFIQKMYMTDTDQPPLFLFDELNAYRITNETMIHILESEGPKAVFEEDKRAGVFLPMFLLYSVRYLRYVKSYQPELYKQNFEANETNKMAIKNLWSSGEGVYRQWTAVLKKAGYKEKPFEASFWKDYLLEKKRLSLN